VPHGGWCPRGRRAHDGRIDNRYALHETPSRAYKQRTEWNVRDSDGTVIFSLRSHLVGGSSLSVAMAALYARPCLHLARGGTVQDVAATLLAFLREHAIGVLNIAGPRAATEPGIESFVIEVLDACRTTSRRAPSGA
jgi:hypothetical protein